MRTLNQIGLVTLSVCLVAAAAPLANASDQSPAASDQTQAAAQPSQGPLVLQPSGSGFVVAPDVRITDLNHNTETLVGGYGGALLDGTFLLGGGAYWLASGSHHQGMWYAGPVVGWFVPLGKNVRFGVRGLVGGGQARVSGQYTHRMPYDYDHNYGRPGYPMGPDVPPAGTTVVQQVYYDQGFFVAEPQVDLVVRVTSWMRFNCGAGYRAVAGAHGANSQIQGVAGSVALQFGRGF